MKKTIEHELEELGDWHATFPGRDAQQVCEMLAELQTKLTDAESGIAQLRESRRQIEKQLAASERACAEMRDMLKQWHSICVPFREAASQRQARLIEHALSSNAGLDHIESSELTPTIELLTNVATFFPEENQEILQEIERLTALQEGTTCPATTPNTPPTGKPS